MKWTFLCLFVALAIVAPCFAANQIRLVPTWNVPRPVDMATDGISNRVYIVSQFGVVYWIDNTNATDTPISTNSSAFHMFLNVTDQVLCCTTPDDERGLLGIAFPPNYRESRRVYIYFGGQPASGSTYQTNYILRYTVMPDFSRVDPSSRTVIWQLDHPFPNHNGGQIKFGLDGHLYVSLGDGGNAGDPFKNGQDLGTQWGTVIRIDVNVAGNATYNIPPTNPFADTNTTMIRREIWAYGLRNPYRFSFDRESGWMILSDAGQNTWEEINVIRRGGNYGWNIVEGPACFDPPTGCNRTGLIEPIFAYNHSLEVLNPDDIVVIGGYVYRGQSVDFLRGKYLFADAVSGVIWAMTFHSSDPYDNTVEIIFQQNLLFISSFGVDQNRELYVLSLRGTVYRVARI